MKRILVITLVLLVMLAAVPVVKLMRFEVENKSGYDAYITLVEVSYDIDPIKYYLHIPEAGVHLPTVRMFTLVRGVYTRTMVACEQEEPTVFLNYNLNMSERKLIILPCAMKDAKSGDGVDKYNPTIYPFEDPYGMPLIYDLGGVYNWRY